MKKYFSEKKKKFFEKRTIALMQIIILVIATIAFSWMVGSDVKVVSADGGGCVKGVDPDVCVSNNIEECGDDGQYHVKRTCSKGCVQSSTYVTCAECDIGELECAGNQLLVCSSDRTKFVLKQECPNGCENDACKTTNTANNLPVCGSTGAYGTCMALTECQTVNYNARCVISGQICCALPKTEIKTEDEKNFDWLGTGSEVVGLGLGVNNLGKQLGIIKDRSQSKVITSGETPTTGTPSSTTPEVPAEPHKWYSNLFKKSGNTAENGWDAIFGNAGGAATQIIRNAVWTAVVLYAAYYFSDKYSSERNAGDIMTAGYIGAGVGMAITTIWALLATEASSGPPGWVAGAITIAAIGIYMLFGYQIYSKYVFTYRTSMWQPAEGKNDCEKCNDFKVAGEDACSEYMCHSYGLACEWVNDETKYEKCVEVNKGDSAPPILTPVKEIYGEDVFPDNSKYEYTSSSASAKIVYTGEGGPCVPAFTPIKLAIKTNENANCRISIEAKEGETESAIFDLMSDMAEGTSYTENHTLILPSIITASEEAMAAAGYELTNDGNYRFYIRCKDVRGNINSFDYLMSFCVQQGPDMDPPEITGTNPKTESFIAHGTENIEDFQVYTNEPADCKWDVQPKAYNDMSYTFDTCSQTIDQRISGFDFGCQGKLTGIKEGENKFYIRCRDQPELKGTPNENKRNTGSIQEIILTGTKELVVSEVTINGEENGTIIKDSVENTDVKIEVTTFGGAEEGRARCKYSYDLNEPRSYSQFDNDGNREYLTTNVNNLYLSEGDYKQIIQCFDVAGNIAETMINFSVEVDKLSPNIVRVYKEDTSLKIVTDEEAECYYTDFGCIYDMDEDGIQLISSDFVNHITEWNIEHDFYVKCRDRYGNRPGEDSCSLIVRPFDVLSAQESEE